MAAPTAMQNGTPKPIPSPIASTLFGDSLSFCEFAVPVVSVSAAVAEVGESVDDCATVEVADGEAMALAVFVCVLVAVAEAVVVDGGGPMKSI